MGQLVRSPITRNELITLVTVRTLSQKAGVTMRNVRTALIIDHNWDNGRGPDLRPNEPRPSEPRPQGLSREAYARLVSGGGLTWA